MIKIIVPHTYPNARYLNRIDFPRRLGIHLWILVEDYLFQFTLRGRTYTILIPKGFIWDGASIPRVAWSLIGATNGGPMLLPSLLHDVLYRSSGLAKFHGQEGLPMITCIDNDGENLFFSRSLSDTVFLDILLWTEEFKKVQCRLCWRAVHHFGKKHFGGPCPSM